MPLPTPIGKQKEVVCLTPEGHVVVLGTAGSGKTTMAIHRAAYVADPRTDHGGRTLLVTFNRALVTYLKHLCPPELRHVDVRDVPPLREGLSPIAWSDVVQRDLRQRTVRETIISEAIAAVGTVYNGDAAAETPARALLRGDPVDQQPWDRDRGGVHRRRAHRPVRSTAPASGPAGDVRGVRGIPATRASQHGFCTTGTTSPSRRGKLDEDDGARHVPARRDRRGPGLHARDDSITGAGSARRRLADAVRRCRPADIWTSDFVG